MSFALTLLDREAPSIMTESTHSEVRGRRALVILIAVVGVTLLGLLALAVLWSRAAATSELRRIDPDPKAAQFALIGAANAANAANVANAADAASARYNARWTYAEGATGRARVHRAIDEATADMDLISRDIARSRLRDELTPASGEVIEINLRAGGAGGGTVDLRIGDCPVIHAAPLGEWVDWRCGGADLRVQHELVEGALVQRSRGGDTVVNRAFTVEDGRLIVDLHLDHERLPATVSFGLGYLQ